jgi:hypothetical protein
MTLVDRLVGLGIAIILIIAVGVAVVDTVNTQIAEVNSYCFNHTSVEMYDTGKGIANCTVVREGRMVAI